MAARGKIFKTETTFEQELPNPDKQELKIED
jgi:hypothetical protein